MRGLSNHTLFCLLAWSQLMLISRFCHVIEFIRPNLKLWPFLPTASSDSSRSGNALAFNSSYFYCALVCICTAITRSTLVSFPVASWCTPHQNSVMEVGKLHRACLRCGTFAQAIYLCLGCLLLLCSAGAAADIELRAANRALMASLAEQGVDAHILASGAVSLYSQAEVDEAQQWLDEFVAGFVSASRNEAILRSEAVATCCA